MLKTEYAELPVVVEEVNAFHGYISVRSTSEEDKFRYCFMTNYFQRSDAFMKKKKINPQEFDCGCCGNQIYKSRLRDEVKCCYCGYINHVGKYTGRRKRLG